MDAVAGKLGGQNKVPRMDGSGTLTHELVDFLRHSGQIVVDLGPGVRAEFCKGRVGRAQDEAHSETCAQAACFFAATSSAIW